MIEQILSYEADVNLWVARAVELSSLLYVLCRRLFAAAAAAAEQTTTHVDDRAVAGAQRAVEGFFRVIRAFSLKWAAGPDTLPAQSNKAAERAPQKEVKQ